MADKGDPAYWHCQMHEGFLNGVQARWADTAQTEEEKARVSRRGCAACLSASPRTLLTCARR